MILKSKDFCLRPFKKEDAASLQRNINDEYVHTFTLRIPNPYKKLHAKEWIASYLKLARRKKKSRLIFAIDIDGEAVGSIGLENIEKYKAEIGYWLAKKYRNKGIMTKAIKIIVKIGFDKIKLKRIYAFVFSKNKISAHLLEKAGFKKDELLKNYLIKSSRLIDCISYSKVK
jgi:RimJ/RimL family protein N-acetyltransferase